MLNPTIKALIVAESDNNCPKCGAPLKHICEHCKSKCPTCGSPLKYICEHCQISEEKTFDGIIRDRVSVIAYSGNKIILTVDKKGNVMLPGGSEIETTLKEAAFHYLKKRINMKGRRAVKIFEYDNNKGFPTSKGMTMNRHHVFYIETDENEAPKASSGWITKILEWDPLTPVPTICTHGTQEILSKIQKEYIDKSTGKFILPEH